MLGKYGFYESVDYTTSRLKSNQTKEIVETYMAHHQGLILLSINNFINNKILIDRFYKNPEIEAIDILLQERMPQKAIVTKEKKEKVEKLKIRDYQNYSERVYTKVNKDIPTSNVISNGTYTVLSLVDGRGYSKYKNILINKFKETDDYSQGNFFYVKNLSNNQIISANIEKDDEGKVVFAPDCIKTTKTVGNIKIKTINVIAPDEPVEIRRLEITNEGTQTENLEVINYFEPVLSSKEQEYSHPAFNNLFVTYEQIETGEIIVKRKKRGFKEKDIYLGVNLYTENPTIGNLEFEINKERFFGQGNISGMPTMIENSKPFSNSISQVTESVLATKRIIKLEAGKKAIVDLVMCVSKNKDNIIETLNEYRNTNAITKVFELSRAKTEAETIYLGLTGRDIEKYQKMLSLLIFQNPMKYLGSKAIPNKVYSQSDLWKFGISGDLPILLVKIRDVNEKYILKDVLKAYEFFRNKNIKIELVILNREINSYEHYLEHGIDGEIQNRQLMYLKNTFGGIFTINENELEKEDLDLLEFRANLILDASSGNVETQLKDLEEEFSGKRIDMKRRGRALSLPVIDGIETLNEDYTHLKYYNEYGGFTENGSEYKFKVSNNQKLPTVWSTILANPEFGTLVTQNLGGFTWHKNSRLNRITAWNNTPSRDIPSEIIYLEDLENGREWILSQNISKNQEYHLTYGFGYVNLKTLKDEILHELDTFVPLDSNVKINILRLKNTSSEQKKLKIVYYIKPVLGEDEIKTSGYIKVEQKGDFVTAVNMYKQELKNEEMFVTSNKKINAFTGDKDEFLGKSNLNNPKKYLGNKDGLYKKPCIAIEIETCLDAYEAKNILLNLGVKQENEFLNEDYRDVEKCEDFLKKTKQYWFELLNKVHVNTPVESMNIMLNGWSGYQSIVSRLWAKSGYYQSGGAIGFRDQLQDTLGVKYIDVNFMKEQILIAAKHQFIEGDVEHWWHEETGRGIRTRFSDDLLWLPYVVCEYIDYTGDTSILDEKVPYLAGEILPDGIDEKYDKYEQSDIKEPLYNHCIRAIEKSLDFGENGLPKIGSGDWNDGLNTVGNNKKGESVWLGFFLYNVLDRFIKVCNIKEDTYRQEKYEDIKIKLKKSLNNNAWDGRWFRRAYMDSGHPIGSIENEECRIDSISQSWGVISDAADNDKKYISMESLENLLVDKENGLIKLLDPPFEKTKIEPGYIKSYLPGVRENGGQYTHAAMWAIMAWTKLGFGDKATEYYTMINPIEHSKTKDAANKYKVEPYVIPADIYEAKGLEGRGGWTWYTGSSSWFCKIGLENILGLNINDGILAIKPCIPKYWKEYSIRYKFGNSIYNIKVKNPEGKNTGVREMILNGIKQENLQIKLIDDGNVNEVEVVM